MIVDGIPVGADEEMQPERANRGKAVGNQRNRETGQQRENRQRKNKRRGVENPIAEQTHMHRRSRALAPHRRNTVSHRTF